MSDNLDISLDDLSEFNREPIKAPVIYINKETQRDDLGFTKNGRIFYASMLNKIPVDIVQEAYAEARINELWEQIGNPTPKSVIHMSLGEFMDEFCGGYVEKIDDKFFKQATIKYDTMDTDQMIKLMWSANNKRSCGISIYSMIMEVLDPFGSRFNDKKTKQDDGHGFSDQDGSEVPDFG